MFKYRKAFLRNDGERYHAFLEAVSSGEKQLHADNLAPYEIVRSALNANRWGFHADLTVGEKAALNASWASLPDFCDNRNALAVVDTSGSMYCYDNALPAAVALSLGLYFGERNIKVHFGKVSKIQYANGASISPTTGNYDYYTPATPMPRIISSGSQSASIEAIKKYFCSEYAVKLVAQQTGIAYEELIGGQYKLFLEPIAYFKHNGIKGRTQYDYGVDLHRIDAES